ncbi:MAG: MmcQ/YjbR family DNA-binding protein [Acidimicrobiales bacterium]
MSGRAAKQAAGLRESVLRQCGSLTEAELDYPFGDGAAVFKVVGKMFALVSLGDPPGSVTLKCDPEECVALCQAYPSVTPGYHMNKRHWVTVELAGSLPAALLPELVRGSYDLVVAALPAGRRPAAG